MTTNASSPHSVYPGNFVPVTDEKDIQEELKNSGDNNIILPYINVKECIDLYEVQVSAPGIEREEFVVYNDDNSLMVSATDKNTLESKHFQRHIPLPLNAETDLTVAEFKDSVLHFYVPKTKQPSKHPTTRIVVY